MEQAFTLLAIDTALGGCSVAVMRDGVVVAQAQDNSSNSQSRVLVPMIESVLGEAKCEYKDLGAVACTLGPGGFTSIRVGLATARAIALATGKPLIGVTTLEVMAFASGITGDIVASVDAHRGQWYAQRFRRNPILSALCEPLLADEKGVKALAHGAKLVTQAPDAGKVAALAQDKWARGERSFGSDPVYIREPDAKLPAAS